MKTTIQYLMLALIVVFTCVSISSCIDEEEDSNLGIGNYYFELVRVETNCIFDSVETNSPDYLYSQWISSNQTDAEGKVNLGKMNREYAREWFAQTIETLVNDYDSAYKGKDILPQNGYIIYQFHLGSDASYGGAEEYSTIYVSNSGAYER